MTHHMTRAARRGISVIEAVIALALTGIIIAAMTGVLMSVTAASRTTTLTTNNTITATATAALINADLHAATTCDPFTGPISELDSRALTMNVNTNNDTLVDTIRWVHDPDTSTVTRHVHLATITTGGCPDTVGTPDDITTISDVSANPALFWVADNGTLRPASIEACTPGCTTAGVWVSGTVGTAPLTLHR